MKTFVQRKFYKKPYFITKNYSAMKKIILSVVLLSSFNLAQSPNSNSLQEFRNHISNSIHSQESSFKYQSTGIDYPEQINIFPSAEGGKKSPGLAILYSLVLPGMGELYANGYGSGKYFTIADGILWGTFTGYTLYGNWKRSSYQTLAETNADALMQDKDEEFKANVGIYMSQEDYNRTMELERSFEKTYNSKNYYWNWKTNEQRKEYRDLWISSEAALNNVRFVVGALILNRVISAINAVRLVSAFNKNISTEVSWNVYFGVDHKL
jgi:hypothetical protein